MTNEELAARIKAGEAGLYGELWENMRRLIGRETLRFYLLHTSSCDGAGVTPEDLLQCGFLALYDAVQAYDPASGYKLTTFLKYPLKTQISEALGTRTRKRRPLNGCTSLDLPIGEDEDGATLGDMVPDPEAAMAIEDAERRADMEALRRDLDACLSVVDSDSAEVIRARFYQGNTLDAVAAARGVDREQVRKLEQKGLAQLRKGKAFRALRQYRDEYIQTHATQYVSFEAWKQGGSVEERLIERLELRRSGRI